VIIHHGGVECCCKLSISLDRSLWAHRLLFALLSSRLACNFRGFFTGRGEISGFLAREVDVIEPRGQYVFVCFFFQKEYPFFIRIFRRYCSRSRTRHPCGRFYWAFQLPWIIKTSLDAMPQDRIFCLHLYRCFRDRYKILKFTFFPSFMHFFSSCGQVLPFTQSFLKHSTTVF
jgi:hypothetical protein